MKTTANTTTTTKVARIFQDIEGFFVCDASLPYLDTRGPAYRSRREAIAALRDSHNGWTHYLRGSRKIRI